MKLPRQRSDEQRAIERARAAGPLDSGETRAIMIGAVVLTIFLYFIKLILLPFVLAGIVAYILTPVLDWAAKRSGLPRVLLAVVLFLLLFGLTALVLVFAGQRLLVEGRGIAADLQSIIETLPARPSATSRSAYSARRSMRTTSLKARSTGCVIGPARPTNSAC